MQVFILATLEIIVISLINHFFYHTLSEISGELLGCIAELWRS